MNTTAVCNAKMRATVKTTVVGKAAATSAKRVAPVRRPAQRVVKVRSMFSMCSMDGSEEEGLI